MAGGNCLKFLAAAWLGALAVFALGPAPGRAESAPPLPLTLPGPQWRPLSQIGDRGLQAELDRALRRNQLWRSLVKEGKMAVALVHLADPEAPRFAQVNGDTMMGAASLPKLAILLAAFQGFENGSLRDSPQVQADLIEMVRRSDNAAASRMVARIGLEKIEALLIHPRYRFYEVEKGGGLWLGSGYAPGGPRDPEPLQGLLHAATARQVCRFYYLLAYGRLINPLRSQQMLKILAFPDLHDKFVKVLEPAVPLNRLYRKSGRWQLWHSDSILVWGEPWRRYILVCLVEHQQGEQVLEELVPVVEYFLRAK